MFDEIIQPQFNHPDEEQLTTDFLISSFGPLLMADLDLETKTPKESLLSKAEAIKASQISDAGDSMRLAFHGIDGLFARTLSGVLRKITTDSDVSAAQLLQAYEIAVSIVTRKTVAQFSSLMFMSEAVIAFLDHFNVPSKAEVIKDIEADDPELAEKLRERTKRWMEGV